MEKLTKPFLYLALLAFVLAVVTAFTGPLFPGPTSEGFSHACTNLSLLAIGISLAFKPGQGD